MAKSGAGEMSQDMREGLCAWLAPIWWAERRAMDLCAKLTSEVGTGLGNKDLEQDKLFLCRQASDELRHYNLYTSLMVECGFNPWELQAKYVDPDNSVVRQKPEKAPYGIALDKHVAPGVKNDLAWTTLSTQFAAENLAIVVFDHIYRCEQLADGVRDILDGIIADEAVHAEYGEESLARRLESGEIDDAYVKAAWPALMREIEAGTRGAWNSISEEAVTAKKNAGMYLGEDEIVSRTVLRMTRKLDSLGVSVGQ